MGAFKIYSYCKPDLISKLVEGIAVYLTGKDINDISNRDYCMMDIRVCVDFDVADGCLILKDAELLDSEWDVLHEDSEIFRLGILPLVDEYNRSRHKLTDQANNIYNEQIFLLDKY